MKKTFILAAASIALFALTSSAQAVTGRMRVHTAGATVAAGSYNGNTYVRGHAVTQSGSSTTVTSGGSFKLNNGAYGARNSTTTVNSDGSATHSGSASATGVKGSVSSTGNFTRNADGTSSGSRSTDITNAATGETYTGTTSYSSSTGISHTGICHDAAGAVVACPSR